MAATGTTQTTSTAASSASPAAGATTSTAGSSTAAASPASESLSPFAAAFAADVKAAHEGAGTDEDQANRGANAANANNKGKKGKEKPEGQTEDGTGEAGSDAGGEGEGEEGQEGGAGAGEETEDGTGEAGSDAGGEGEGEAGEEGTEESTEELPDEVDPAKPPKGMEKVPKKVWERFNKVTKENKELRAQVAQGSIKLTPTAASPLADVTDVKVLNQRIASAKMVRDYVEQNPDSVTEGAKIKRADGSTIELTADQVKARLANAKAEIEAGPDVQARLKERAESKPWETAAKLSPDLFKKGTDSNNFLRTTLQEVPEIAQKMSDWEVFMAAAQRGYSEILEEQSGKAKYQRYALDPKTGEIIPPKADTTGANNRPKPKTPGNNRPAPRGPGTPRPTAEEALARLPATATQEQRARAALAAELG